MFYRPMNEIGDKSADIIMFKKRRKYSEDNVCEADHNNHKLLARI